MDTTERPASTIRPDDTQTNRLRQGIAGQGLRAMLGWGIAGVVVAFIIVYVLVF